jgi:Arc/MetJ family transcription regulator
MRTNIEIDDDLMAQAMAATNTTTKKAAVEAALRRMVQLKNQGRIRELRGKVVWRSHDDDWFASDEEILEKRSGELTAKPTNTSIIAVELEPILVAESR